MQIESNSSNTIESKTMKDKTSFLPALVENVEKAIYGKREIIELVLCAFLCNGHVLIEDVPGVGKTSLVSALARSFSCSFRRIQFTPDILPSDITGFSMYNQKTGEFEYKEGAIMSQIILADEINRTSPKTQSSLLEVMEENQVTVDGKTYILPKPFIVLATQNPIDYMGTYPLPEAQLDRFLMRISIGYPSAEVESEMLSMYDVEDPIKNLKAVATADDLIALQSLVQGVYVDIKIKDYITAIIRKTRENEFVQLGGSPRASIDLYKASKAWAIYNNRDYVIPDDVKRMAAPVIEHRLVLKQEAKYKKITTESIVMSSIENVVVPVIKII